MLVWWSHSFTSCSFPRCTILKKESPSVLPLSCPANLPSSGPLSHHLTHPNSRNLFTRSSPLNGLPVSTLAPFQTVHLMAVSEMVGMWKYDCVTTCVLRVEDFPCVVGWMQNPLRYIFNFLHYWDFPHLFFLMSHPFLFSRAQRSCLFFPSCFLHQTTPHLPRMLLPFPE